MAVRNLDAFKSAKNANETMVQAMVNAKKNMLISLLEDLKPFVSDLCDMQDTYNAVRKESKEYADKLCKFLKGYDTQNTFHIDMNSYFGVCAIPVDYHIRVELTPLGLAIYYHPVTQKYTDDWDSKHWRGNNALSYVTNNDFSEEILDKYIASAKGLLEYFPRYSEKFFDLVSNPVF